MEGVVVGRGGGRARSERWKKRVEEDVGADGVFGCFKNTGIINHRNRSQVQKTYGQLG